MAVPILKQADFLAAFLRLFPRGRAWSALTATGTVIYQVCNALMPTYVRSYYAAANLLVDGFPATSVDLLPQWQAALGLPNACTPLGATLAQQQAQVVAQFIAGSGATPAYFIALAALYGYTITIVEGAPATRTWTVHSSSIAPPLIFRAGRNRAGDRLETVSANSQLECILNAVKPADTNLVFSFP
jgi:uncharacterized protein YmfQ (DUF2313 family)